MDYCPLIEFRAAVKKRGLYKGEEMLWPIQRRLQGRSSVGVGEIWYRKAPKKQK